MDTKVDFKGVLRYNRVEEKRRKVLFIMENTTYSRQKLSQEDFVKAMDAYIARLKRMPKDQAYKESLEALKRTGVLTKDGQPKEQIVSDF